MLNTQERRRAQGWGQTTQERDSADDVWTGDDSNSSPCSCVHLDISIMGHLAALRQMSADLGPCTLLRAHHQRNSAQIHEGHTWGCTLECHLWEGRWAQLGVPPWEHEEASGGSGMGWGGVWDAPHSTHSSRSTSVFTGQPGWILKL